MAGEAVDPVDIFNDFDDAEVMVNTFCDQVCESEYREDIRTETNKALGELCLFLDQNPDVYARVLRKRKQEEMEASGVFSFVKSKMMSLVHGERYPQCLLSTSECIQNTNALKSGMCKTFQLSQELKETGHQTRQSSRLAAKRQSKMSTNKQSHCSGQVEEASSSSKSLKNDQPKLPVLRDTTNVLHLSSNSSEVLGKCNSSVSATGLNIDGYQKIKDEKDVQQCGRDHKIVTDVKVTDRDHKTVTVKEVVTEIVTNQPAQIGISQSTTIPVPPPAPPLPASFNNSSLPKNFKLYSQQPHTSSMSNLSSKSPTPGPQRSTPFMQYHISLRKGASKVPSRSQSVQDLSSPSSSSSTSSPFLTPDLPKKYKTHQRSQSNSSVSSMSSCGSFSSLHSEIISTNPISRLKATHIVRSPGGTPARQSTTSLSTEPFHRTLYTALKSRFKNVNTPSPRSGNASINTSNKSLLNNTFSP